MAYERLDKLIASQGTLSRSDVKKLIGDKKVLVNGVFPKSYSDKIDTEKDILEINGKAVNTRKFIYLMLNKPMGVVSATADKSEKTVVDLVPPQFMRKGLFPAGRLDKDTTGFVLLTDDGAFAHSILSPKNHVPKTYEALILGKVTDEMFRLFEKGIPIGKGDVCKPAKLKVIGSGENDKVEVIITEGMYHQIKRMFEACGSKVLMLKRIQIGGLPLDNSLPEGICREISNIEIDELLGKKNKDICEFR